MPRIQMAAHWDIHSPCSGTHPEAGKKLSEREALNLEKAKNGGGLGGGEGGLRYKL